MTRVEEIERAAEQLSPGEFVKLANWVEQRRRQLQSDTPAGDETPYPLAQQSHMILRDHSAFMDSYAPEDEGLYDDAAAR